ncbi:MAG: hypothetical protein IPH93_08740 [Saprospiraceae bacterium]|nr:hypothetical protein [Saprospiraceae bacterium]
MIKKVILSCLIVLGFINAHGQILDPVKWTTEVKDLGNQEYELIFKAKLDPKWAIYSQKSDPDAATPTEISFKPGRHYQLIGEVTELGKRLRAPNHCLKILSLSNIMNKWILFKK